MREKCGKYYPIEEGDECFACICDRFKEGKIPAHVCIRGRAGHNECVCSCGKEWFHTANDVIEQELHGEHAEALSRASVKLANGRELKGESK
jgi:hypothetical protein